MEILYLIFLIPYGIVKGIIFLVKWTIKHIKKKKQSIKEHPKKSQIANQQHINKKETNVYAHWRKYPRAFDSFMNELNVTVNNLSRKDYRTLGRISEFCWIERELQEDIKLGLGFVDEYLESCSPFSFRIYVGQEDAKNGRSRKYSDIFNVFFTKYYFAIDFYIRNEYKSNKYLNETERTYIQTMIPDILESIETVYHGNFDDLSFDSKWFLVSNMAAIISAYHTYVNYAVARKKVQILHDTCLRSFDYVCLKETGKTFKKNTFGTTISSVDELTSDETATIAEQFDYCKQLEYEWDRIDYSAAMTQRKEVLSKGEILENELNSKPSVLVVGKNTISKTNQSCTYSLRESLKLVGLDLAAKQKIQKGNCAMLQTKVNKWPTIHGIRYKFLYYYYLKEEHPYLPYSENKIRKMIASFKNYIFDENILEDVDEANCTIHQREKKYVFTKVENALLLLLNQTFTKDELRMLTFVCVPATTKKKYWSRFKMLSQEICRITGMNEALQYINYIEDGIPKPFENAKKAIVEYDNDFFEGRNVLLFDDIVMTGDNIYRTMKEIEQMGAKVICCISLAKTSKVITKHPIIDMEEKMKS